jgi:photosystem II stability/assembly factor-like uncharacterized protein
MWAVKLFSIFLLGIFLTNPLSASGSTQNRLKLPALIADHMVLQRDQAAVWGRDLPGQEVTVTLQSVRNVSKADAAGKWRVEMRDLPAGGPYDMTIAGSASVTIRDVYVGEVWVGSGQSNMEMSLKETLDAGQQIALAQVPKIRLFLQGHAMAAKPALEAQGRWVVCSPETAGDFPAAAYFFALNLQKKLGVPVGLLVAAWGGSFIESWMARDAFEASADGKALLAEWAQRTRKDLGLWNGGASRKLELANLRFLPKDPAKPPLAISQGTSATSAPDSGLGGLWKSDAAAGSSVSYSFSEKGGPKKAPAGRLTGTLWGGAWGFIGTQLKPDGTGVDLSAYDAIEFEARGDGQYFIFTPQPSITDADNYLTPPFTATPQWKRHRISLDGLKQSGWGTPKPRTKEAVSGISFGVVVPALAAIPTVMYNGMIHPLTAYSIRGAIWYQGEANEGHATEYGRFLPLMIRSWRKAWGQKDFPFLIAQLPLFRDPTDAPGESDWAEIREAQAMARREPKVETAVLLDLGEAKSIHPGNKSAVGERLAMAALHTAYGMPGSWTGPRFGSMTVEEKGKKATIHFEEAGKGLETRGGGSLTGFTLAGKDGGFRRAQAKIEGDSVVVWNEEVAEPKAVRYGWADNPVCNLFGKNGLPAEPFRTDRPLPGAEKPKAVPYAWKSVQIVGGGFVDGFVFHPTAKDVCYARTDMGGAYRRNPETRRWEPMLDWIPYRDLNLMGVESIAVDPSDPNQVYLACGTYTAPDVPDGAILRSSDQGRTFQRTNVPIKFGGNEGGRGNGERMAVDPNDGRILFLGTRHRGLWRSRDGAATWNKVDSFPSDVLTLPPEEAKLPAWSGGGRSSIVFVVFDPASGTQGKASQTLFAGVSVMGKPGLYRSNDAGKTWKAVPGQPTHYRPNHAILASDGHLFITYGTDPGPMPMVDGGVWKLDIKSDAWTDITPDKPSQERKFGYAAVAVDAKNPQVLIASSFYRPKGEDLFRSTDGGATWKPVFGSGGVYDYSLAPYVRDTDIHWLFDVEIDPANSDHALFTTGYGGWETYDLTNLDKNLPTHWTVMSPGIEETVALALYSPSKGAPLVTAVGDYSGFVHWDLDKPAPGGTPKPPFLGNTHDVSGGELNPNVIVRIGRPRAGKNLGYSLDGGRTWREPASVPDAKAKEGHIAVSSNGGTWVWTPRDHVPYVTTDEGATWTACTGLPKDTRVVADRVNRKRFYGIALFEGKLFESLDGAAHFTERPLVLSDGLPKRAGAGDDNRSGRGDDRGGQDRIYATPGREGDLWLAAYGGLYHSGAKGFERMPAVEEIHAFGFGKADPRAHDAALYLVGIVQGQRGFFRSTDSGATWVRINDDQHQWGLVLHITGDPKQFGRVYVGTHGRGTFYGDPAGK